MDPSQRRKLSFHERYAVTRRNLGFPQAITLIVSYPTAQDLPSAERLAGRIQDLHIHFPLLNAAVQGTKTQEPYFQLRNKPTPSSLILRDVPLVPGAGRAQILQDELEHIQNIDTGILWQVTRYTSATTSFLALSSDHALLDGRGLFKLLDYLVRDDISDLLHESVADVPRLEDTLNVKPDAMLLLGLVYRELFVPKLPSFLQAYLVAPPSWPTGQVSIAPNQCPPIYTLLDLPLQTVVGLKAAGRLHQVQTLHPILKLSYAVAIWSVVGRPSSMQLQSPASVRDTKLGHSQCTACYTASHSVPFQPTSGSDFWKEAAAIGAYMSSAIGKRRALQEIGSLSLVPDYTSSADGLHPTGWEKFFSEKMDNKKYSGSLEISNIGHVDLPTGANDLCWGQAASPLSTPFGISVVGHLGGLRVAGAFRDGSVVDSAAIESVHQVWKRVLDRLVDPVRSDWTLGALVAEE